MRFRYLPIFIITLLSFLFISGQVMAEDESEMSEMAELLLILEEETEVATKTKMNADYVPGIVTVFHGEDLEALGARTVWEALGFVPGVETRLNDLGRPMVVVRGISGSRHTGHLKLMVDSIGANPSFRGTNDALMMVPIEQVERIEVIRGSGSSLYGEFSYTGVVNIITRKDGNRLFGSAAKYNTYGTGGLYSHSNDEKDLKISINAAGWDSNGADVNSGIDHVEQHLGQTGISFSPGPTNEDEQVRSLAINLDYKKTSLSFYGVKRNYGAYFGTGALLPDSDGTPKESEYWHLAARQTLEITPALEGVLKINYSKDETEDVELLLPPGAAPSAPPGESPITFTDGNTRITFVDERRIEGGGELTWTGWEKHTWLLGLSAAEVEIRDAWEASNFNGTTMTLYDTIQLLPGDEDVWIDAGKKRHILSGVMQDQLKISDDFTITAAVRYDDYNDVGSEVTPRIAGVWKVDGPHLMKFQYAEAYRPPTMAELYLPESGAGAHGNPDLSPETSKNYEAGYIYRKPGFVGRATLYYSKMEDMIVLYQGGPNDHYPVNSDEIELKGAELEVEKQFLERWKVIANISYTDAYDKTNEEDLEGSTEWLGNLMVQGKVSADLMAVIGYQHVGDRSRDSDDTRDDLKGYDTVDLTINRFNLGLKGLTVRAGIKNIFDEEIKDPSNDYQDDLLRPGRTWWTQVSRDF